MRGEAVVPAEIEHRGRVDFLLSKSPAEEEGIKRREEHQKIEGISERKRWKWMAENRQRDWGLLEKFKVSSKPYFLWKRKHASGRKK